MKHGTLTAIFALLSTTLFSQQKPLLMKDLLSDYQFETKHIKIDSLNISYIQEGHGDTTLLFLHGLSSNSDAWSRNIDTLKNHYNCIALDLPGYGKSSKPNADYTPSYFASVVHAFIEKLQLKEIVLVGHSMGGQASIKLAVQYPETVKQLILVAPAGLEQFSDTEAQIIKSIYTSEMIKATTDEQIRKNYALNFFKQPEEVSKMIEDRIRVKTSADFDQHCDAISKSVAGMLNDPVFGDLKNIQQNTLLIFGKEDMLIPNKYFHPDLSVETIGEIGKKEIEQIQVIYVNESGHFVQFEKPQEINSAIRSFIAQN
jgi:pimeloyl-ACP methyl ester carboxylesterase